MSIKTSFQFTEEDHKRLLFDVSILNSGRNDIFMAFPQLMKYEEFVADISPMIKYKVFKYIAYVYDRNSKLNKIHSLDDNLTKIKGIALELAGFTKKNGVYHEGVQEMVMGMNTKINAMIVRYCLLFGSTKYARYMVAKDAYTNKLKAIKNKEETTAKDFKDLDEFEKIMKEFHDEVMNKDYSGTLGETFYYIAESGDLKLRVEDIVSNIQKGIKPIDISIYE